MGLFLDGLLLDMMMMIVQEDMTVGRANSVQLKILNRIKCLMVSNVRAYQDGTL